MSAEKWNAVVTKELRLRGRGQGKVNGDGAGKIHGRQKGRSDETARNLVFANHAQPDARSPAERANLTTHGLTALEKCQLKGRPNTMLTRTQLIKDPRRRKTIRNPTVFGLEIANRRARLEAKQTVRFANIIPAARQQLLKFQPLRP